MKLRTTFAAILLYLVAVASAQTPPKPKDKQAPGAGPDKVWVNTATNIYHCPGATYYGKTKEGKYLTEAQAKKEGDKAARGEACFK